MRTLERRAFDLSEIQIRAANEGEQRLHFTGRAVVYDQLSADLGGWQEVIKPGAASRSLESNPDVRFLLNHDANKLLARTTSGTLRLTEDSEGVLVDADMANVSYARDLAELLERGDLTQMSFGFWVTRDEWNGSLHVVREFDFDGGDVAAVTYPAYPQTSAELRSIAAAHLERDKPAAPQVRELARDLHTIRELDMLAKL
ncbi:HK97 family phage prohead protease [Pseudoclavibacter sp. RFBG4]|nr:HK97 family phage prohead protease [Pseudoclavibacter sp. RFBG4]